MMSWLALTSVRPDRERARLIVVGTLDGWGATELGRHLTGLLDAGALHVLVDLSRMHGWDVRGTDVLTAVSCRLWNRGSLSVQGLQPYMLDGVYPPATDDTAHDVEGWDLTGGDLTGRHAADDTTDAGRGGLIDSRDTSRLTLCGRGPGRVGRVS